MAVYIWRENNAVFCGKPMFGGVTYAYAYLEDTTNPIYSMVQKFSIDMQNVGNETYAVEIKRLMAFWEETRVARNPILEFNI